MAAKGGYIDSRPPTLVLDLLLKNCLNLQIQLSFKQYEYKFALKLIRLLSVPDFFPLYKSANVDIYLCIMGKLERLFLDNTDNTP